MIVPNKESISKRSKILQLAGKMGLIRPRDLGSIGVDPAYVRHMATKGDLIRLGRGLYALPKLDFTENHTLAEVATWIPNGVFCLLTAARFHQLGTENPGPIWLALDRGKRRPVSTLLPKMHLIHLSPRAMRIGVDVHIVEGVTIRVTSPARTVVDLFRFRRRAGLETALVALRQALRNQIPISEIRQYAVEFRAMTYMRPYLEALL